MTKEGITEQVEIPSGVSVSKEGMFLIIKGPKGELRKAIKNTGLDIRAEGSTVVFASKKNTKTDVKIIFTYKALVKNWFKGVTEAHVYKLKICSSHFPMSASVKGEIFELKNFVGGSKPRTLKITQGVKAKVESEIITLEGIDKEAVGNFAAKLEKMTRRAAFYNLVFQDGIYITSKDGESLD
ncbi:MAG: 50S ribosomal protein L6 [Candidatus Woesearchaeota archaeon]